MKARLLVLGLMLALGCESGPVMGTPLVPETTALASSDVVLAIPLDADGALLVDDGAHLAIIRPGVAEPTVLGESGELGTVAASTTYDGTTLVSGTAGTFVVTASGIFRAPLDAALEDGESVVTLSASARAGAASDLWVATDRGLYVFRDDTLVEARIADVDLASARIADAGSGAVWVATDERVLRLTVASDEIAFTARVLTSRGGAESIAVDSEGVLWMVEDGGLSALRRDDRIVVYPIPLTVVGVHASRGARDLWIRGDDGMLFHQLDRIFRYVSGASASDAWSGGDGALVAQGTDGVRLLRARHPFALEGLHDGPLLESTDVTVVLTDAEHVTSLRVDVDGITLEATGTPPTFSIAPGVVGIGEHVLRVDVDYDDGTLRSTISRSIEVQSNVTYEEQIRPLYVTYCADCHGATGPSPTRLDSREPWMRLSARILENVETGRMPLGRPPMPPDAIALIETWIDAGYPE